MISEVGLSYLTELGLLLLALVVPGLAVFFSAVRWGRRAALIAGGLGDLWGWGLCARFVYLAFGCPGCERGFALSTPWDEMLARHIVEWAPMFFVLWPFHLAWIVVAGAAGVFGLRRRARATAVVNRLD